MLCREKSILGLLAVLLAIYSHSGFYIKNTESVNPTPVYILDLGCRSYMVIIQQVLKNAVYTVGFLFFYISKSVLFWEGGRAVQDSVFQRLQICLPCI